MTENEVSSRLAVLEKEVAELKRWMAGSSGNWPDRVFGRMKEFPEFEQVVQLGQELRNTQSDPLE